MSERARTRLVRLAESGRATLTFFIDGEAATALAGDTLLVALLTQRDHLRRSEFGSEQRSGFCLMGACQDCWVWSEGGARLRACTTVVSEGLRISIAGPGGTWLRPE
jgi:D-hydroxyproline dehydrogenase subunit gamma